MAREVRDIKFRGFAEHMSYGRIKVANVFEECGTDIKAINDRYARQGYGTAPITLSCNGDVYVIYLGGGAHTKMFDDRGKKRVVELCDVVGHHIYVEAVARPYKVYGQSKGWNLFAETISVVDA